MNINNAVEAAIELGESEIRHNQKENQLQGIVTGNGFKPLYNGFQSRQ